MKLVKYILVVAVLIVSTVSQLHAQEYLEFVENKGQWDKNISFKGDMTMGAFVLKPDGGYRMLLHNSNDLKTFSDYYHGHKQNPKSANEKEVLTSFVAATKNNFDGVTIHSHAYEISFIHSNPNPIAIPDKPINSYNNYFIGNDLSKWAGNCRIFTAVTYKDIYPNVDVRYYTDKGNLKYDVIVRPGGDPSQILLYVDGADGLKVKDGQLVIKTSVSDVKEAAPYSYQSGIKGRSEVDCNFAVTGNFVKFHLNQPINPNQTLVIDPQIIFSTFTGSVTTNWGFSATYDALGNFYAGGIVFNAGFPITNGAVQTQYGGGNRGTGEGDGFDMGIMKFNPLGTARLYATYIGGSGNEYPHSLVADAAGNLVIAGRTSSTDYPKTSNNYGPCGGLFDIIITKISADGSALIGSRQIGGSANDGVNIANKYPIGSGNNVITLRRNYGDDSRSEVILDDNDNVYLSSCTQSTDFPTTANAVQSKNGGTNVSGRAQDAVLMKLTPNLSNVLYSTYLGGSNDDAAFVLAINPINKNIYVAGGTASTNFPGNTVNTLFPTFQGGDCDGFVAIFSNDGSQLLKTSYFGTTGADIIYGIQFDKLGFPYIMGTTTGNWKVTSNVNFKQEGGKQFISKLKPNLSDWVYSTVFGTKSGVPNISPTAFLVDRCENVYVSGWGGKGNTSVGYQSAGTLGLSITPNATKKITDGSDFYFFVLKRDAQEQMYGDFFGQNDNIGHYPDHVDGGTSRFDKNGVIYQSVCANCDGPNGIFYTTPGVVAPSNGAVRNGGCNLAAFKIAFNLAGVGAAIRSSIKGTVGKTYGCLPLTVNFIDIIADGKNYIWDFGDGSPSVKTSADSNSHTYNKTGDYKVMLVSIDSSSCNVTDTSYTTIKVRQDEAILKFAATKLQPPCDTLLFRFDNLSTPPAGKPFAVNSFVLYFGDGSFASIGVGSVLHTYVGAGSYNARLVLSDTNYCNAPDSVPVQLRIASLVKAQFVTDSVGCAPYTAEIQNTSLAGQTFKWDFGDGTTSTNSNPLQHTYNNSGKYTIKLTVIDSTTCNIKSDTSFTINVYKNPVASFTLSPQPPQANVPISFFNQSTNGDHFFWDFGDKDTLRTKSVDTLVSHIYSASGNFSACLTAFAQTGCSSETCKILESLIKPLLNVGNAIAPNGVNNRIKVQGYGITKMNWRIYNRWGEMVYQSTKQKEGWDGKYKGTVLPQDVYTYTLEVEFSDGTKESKTGDITILL